MRSHPARVLSQVGASDAVLDCRAEHGGENKSRGAFECRVFRTPLGYPCAALAFSLDPIAPKLQQLLLFWRCSGRWRAVVKHRSSSTGMGLELPLHKPHCTLTHSCVTDRDSESWSRGVPGDSGQGLGHTPSPHLSAAEPMTTKSHQPLQAVTSSPCPLHVTPLE